MNFIVFIHIFRNFWPNFQQILLKLVKIFKNSFIGSTINDRESSAEFFEIDIFLDKKNASNKLLFPTSFKFAESRGLTSAATIFENSYK